MKSEDGGSDILSRILDVEGAEVSLKTATQAEDEVFPYTPGMCVECNDQPFTLLCVDCKDKFCEVCWKALHRKGSRAKHETKAEKSPLLDVLTKQTTTSSASDAPAAAAVDKEVLEKVDLSIKRTEDGAVDESSFHERAKYIPLRLHYKERRYLRLLKSALRVTEYTDKVDDPTIKRGKRLAVQIKEMCALLSGLVVAEDYGKGQDLLKDRNFKIFQKFFQKLFELGRRYKIMNPDKLRGEYGKLLYLIQDSGQEEIKEILEFSPNIEISTVYQFLEKRDCLELLEHEWVEIATRAIHPFGKERYEVRQEIKQKERAQELLARKFESSKISADEIKHCLYSIGDNNSFLLDNRDPVVKMIEMMTKDFKPDKFEEGIEIFFPQFLKELF